MHGFVRFSLGFPTKNPRSGGISLLGHIIGQSPEKVNSRLYPWFLGAQDTRFNLNIALPFETTSPGHVAGAFVCLTCRNYTRSLLMRCGREQFPRLPQCGYLLGDRFLDFAGKTRDVGGDTPDFFLAAFGVVHGGLKSRQLLAVQIFERRTQGDAVEVVEELREHFFLPAFREIVKTDLGEHSFNIAFCEDGVHVRVWVILMAESFLSKKYSNSRRLCVADSITCGLPPFGKHQLRYNYNPKSQNNHEEAFVPLAFLRLAQ